VRHENRDTAGLLEFLLRTGVFMALGALVAQWMFDNAIAGAALGLATYLVFIFLGMLGDIVAINRELAAFRKGEDSD